MDIADNNGMQDVCAIVPSLNPDGRFLEVVDLLYSRGFGRILVVDDGSRPECRDYFEKAAAMPRCTVIRHYHNLGKGRALKTAFNHCLNHFPHLKGAVTVDADNQHHIDDVVRCAQDMLAHTDALVLGVRDFSQDNVPWRNRMGNGITVWVFNALCGIRISDTQTGLRALSRSLMDLFLDLPGERFEYETNMLIETKRRSVPIRETLIRTVYINGNATSHFRPFLDSVRIYSLIFKFLSASIISCLLDLAVFTALIALLSGTSLGPRVAFATVAARVISSLFNYFANRYFVFRLRKKGARPIIRYYALAAALMLLSMGGVYVLTRLLSIHPTAVKVFVDLVLFLIGFQVQKEWVFSEGRADASKD